MASIIRARFLPLCRSAVTSPNNSTASTVARRLFASLPVKQSQTTKLPSGQVLRHRFYSKEISENVVHGAPQATQKPTPFQKRILVWGKMYPSVDKVPDRVSRNQVKKAMDLFRVRASICMAAMVFVFAAIMALLGRKQRQHGQTMTKIVLERRSQG